MPAGVAPDAVWLSPLLTSYDFPLDSAGVAEAFGGSIQRGTAQARRPVASFVTSPPSQHCRAAGFGCYGPATDGLTRQDTLTVPSRVRLATGWAGFPGAFLAHIQSCQR